MYTFKLNIGSLTSPVVGGGYISVSPLTMGNGIVKKRDDENFFKVRKSLKDKLLFKGDEYEALATLRDNDEKYAELEIFQDSVSKIYGYLLMSGDWDDNKHQCALMFQTVDQYSDFENNLDVEQNILETGITKNTVYVTQSSIVEEVTLPCFDGRSVEAQLYYDPDGQVSQDTGVAHPDWAYYLDNGEATGCSGSEHSYKFVTTYVTFPHPDYTASELYANRYLKAASSSETVSISLDQAIKEYDILAKLINKADSTLTINQSTYCDYINDPVNELDNLFFLDKSDVKRWDASNPALSEIITLEDMLNVYSGWFNLFYEITEAGLFRLRFIEDLSEPNYTTYPEHDLTTLKSKNWVDNQEQYTTDIKKKASKEVLSHEVSKGTLNYELYFDTIKENSFPNFNNAVSSLMTDPEDISDNGFCVVHCNGSNQIINKTVLGIEFVNYEMQPNRLILNHLIKANRPYSSALLGTSPITLVKEKDKEFLFSNLPIYDIDKIDFDYLVKTSAGVGIPYELEVSFNNDFAKIKVKL